MLNIENVGVSQMSYKRNAEWSLKTQYRVLVPSKIQLGTLPLRELPVRYLLILRHNLLPFMSL